MKSNADDNLIDPIQAKADLDENDAFSVGILNLDYKLASRNLTSLMRAIDKPSNGALLKQFGVTRETVVQNILRIMAQSDTKLHSEEYVDTPRFPAL